MCSEFDKAKSLSEFASKLLQSKLQFRSPIREREAREGAEEVCHSGVESAYAEEKQSAQPRECIKFK